jgi:D-sedoheptulose 7-phosphate isomerase
MNNKNLIQKYFLGHAALFEKIDRDEIDNAIFLIEEAFLKGKKIITCGNGGSASTASHFITDWNKMTNIASGKKFRGLSLVDNIGLVTAYANDISYEEVFSGQLRAIMDAGDLIIGISGSGNSKNVINAIHYANNNGGKSLVFVGYDGGVLKQISEHSVWVPSFDMQLCEDIHLMLGHLVMKKLSGLDVIYSDSN